MIRAPTPQSHLATLLHLLKQHRMTSISQYRLRLMARARSRQRNDVKTYSEDKRCGKNLDHVPVLPGVQRNTGARSSSATSTTRKVISDSLQKKSGESTPPTRLRPGEARVRLNIRHGVATEGFAPRAVSWSRHAYCGRAVG